VTSTGTWLRRRLAQGGLGEPVGGPLRGHADHHVRAGEVLDVEPPVVGPRLPQGQPVVLPAVAPRQNGVAVGGAEAQGPGRLRRPSAAPSRRPGACPARPGRPRTAAAVLCPQEPPLSQVVRQGADLREALSPLRVEERVLGQGHLLASLGQHRLQLPAPPLRLAVLAEVRLGIGGGGQPRIQRHGHQAVGIVEGRQLHRRDTGRNLRPVGQQQLAPHAVQLGGLAVPPLVLLAAQLAPGPLQAHPQGVQQTLAGLAQALGLVAGAVDLVADGAHRADGRGRRPRRRPGQDRRSAPHRARGGRHHLAVRRRPRHGGDGLRQGGPLPGAQVSGGRVRVDAGTLRHQPGGVAAQAEHRSGEGRRHAGRVRGHLAVPPCRRPAGPVRRAGSQPRGDRTGRGHQRVQLVALGRRGDVGTAR
jgi:hypothetical protein